MKKITTLWEKIQTIKLIYKKQYLVENDYVETYHQVLSRQQKHLS